MKQFQIFINPHALLFSVMLYLTISQNFIAILLAPHTTLFSQFTLVAKELFMLGVICIGTLYLILSKKTVLHTLYIIMLGIVVYLISVSILSHTSNLLSLRQLLMIPLFILFGIFFASKLTLDRLYHYLEIVFMIVCASAYLERFLFYDPHEHFWSGLNIKQFMIMKGFEKWAYGPGGTPANFYSFDLKFFTGDSVRRMISFLIVEPTLLGHFLVLPTLYAFIKRHWFKLVFYCSTLILTISKGGILCLLLAFGLYFFLIYRNSILNILLKSYLVLFLPTLLAFILYLGLSGRITSLALHLRGLYLNLFHLFSHPLGTGIGSSGNFAVVQGTAILEGSGESYLGAVIGQLGLVGMSLFLGLCISLWRVPVNKQDTLALCLKFTLIATLIASIATESAISYVGTGYLFALVPFLFFRYQET